MADRDRNIELSLELELREQLRLCSDVVDRQMALMDQLREERERLADVAKLFEIALNQTSIRLLEKNILQVVEEAERRGKKRMPGGVPMRLLK